MVKGALKAGQGNEFSGGGGRWIIGFARNIDHCTVYEAELWRALDGVDQAWKMGYRRIMFELDSSIAVNAIKSRIIGSSEIMIYLGAFTVALKLNIPSIL